MTTLTGSDNIVDNLSVPLGLLRTLLDLTMASGRGEVTLDGNSLSETLALIIALIKSAEQYAEKDS